MSLPSKSISLDEDGRLRINQAASKVANAKVTVHGDQESDETELTAGLTKRRKLIIKPLRTAGDDERQRRYIYIGPSGFDRTKGTPVWEEFELVLDIGPEDKIYAKKDFLNDSDLVPVLRKTEAIQRGKGSILAFRWNYCWVRMHATPSEIVRPRFFGVKW